MKVPSFLKRLIPLFILGGSTLVLFNYLSGLAAHHYVIDDLSLIDTPQLTEVSLWKFIQNLVLHYNQNIDFYPLRDLSYWIDIHLFGASSAWGSALTLFRVHNFILFALMGLFLYFILLELGVAVWIAMLGVLLWLAHPIHAELFMWVTSRKDLLSLLFAEMFVLSTIILFQSLLPLGQFNAQDRNIFYRPILLFFSLILFVFSLLSKSSLNLIWIPLSGYAFLQFLNKEKNIRNIRYELVLTILITCVSFGWSFFQGYFYSKVNDMRFNYDWSYRIIASLAALGRASLGVFWPSMNSVDVFNWGDWAHRQPLIYPIFGFSLWLSWFFGFLIVLTRKKNFWLIGLLAIIATYIPISGLIFPHRNFYSVRYFEGVFVVLFVCGVWSLNCVYMRKISVLQKNRFKYSTCAVGVVLWMFFLWLSHNESQHWSGPLSVVEKALRLDPENPSLLAQKLVAIRFEFGSIKNKPTQSMNELREQEKITRDRLNQFCKPKLVEPLSPQGDLCWMYLSFFPTSVLTPKYHGQMWPNMITESEDSRSLREHWFLEHSKRQTSHVLSQNDYLIQLRKGIETGVDSKMTDKAPIGALNTEFHRILVWGGLCSVGNFSEADRLVDSLLQTSLLREDRLLAFSQNYDNNGVLQKCLTLNNSYEYMKRNWVQKSVGSKWNDFHKFVHDGALGIRYGCGRNNPNGYDCGSSMDQAAMINLYAELFWVTMEPKFLKESLKFALNGNSNCYVGGKILTCGEGKALGQMVLALIKLYLVTGDSRIRMTFSQIINPFINQFEINDEWDAFEIYRSSRLVFWLNATNSFNSNYNVLAEQKITASILQKFPNMKSKIDEWRDVLDCTYGSLDHTENHCHKVGPVVEEHKSFIGLSLREMAIDLPNLLQNRLKFSKFNVFEPGAMLWGRFQLADCRTGGLPSDQKSFFQSFIEKKYNEVPKPFYYAEEGDNFAPVILSYYNFLKNPENICARWEINTKLFLRGPPNGRPVVNTFDFVRQPRSLFILPQLKNSNELRIWALNNANFDISIDLESHCPVFPKSKWKKLTVKSHESHTLMIPLATDFKKEHLTRCVLRDSTGRQHFLHL